LKGREGDFCIQQNLATEDFPPGSKEHRLGTQSSRSDTTVLIPFEYTIHRLQLLSTR